MPTTEKMNSNVHAQRMTLMADFKNSEKSHQKLNIVLIEPTTNYNNYYKKKNKIPKLKKLRFVSFFLMCPLENKLPKQM